MLPTEAQWEYACRAGTRTIFYCGDDILSLNGYANTADEGSKAHYGHGDPGRFDGYATHAPVGTYRPNAFGLHDMHGNVAEWCRDWCVPYTQPVRAGDGEREGTSSERIMRGGNFFHRADRATSGDRDKLASGTAISRVGVRAGRAIL